MLTFIISRYNHDMTWLNDYPSRVVLYDRSEVPVVGGIPVPNIGSDIYDKLSFIIDFYDNLPDVAIYTKANLFKYITKEEFDLVRDNKTFTPLLTKHHHTYLPTCWYTDDGMYNELNDRWYLYQPSTPSRFLKEYDELMPKEWRNQPYKKFAPGSNYILPKENILKHPKEFYIKLRDLIKYDRYPGEAFLIERDMYNIFK